MPIDNVLNVLIRKSAGIKHSLTSFQNFITNLNANVTSEIETREEVVRTLSDIEFTQLKSRLKSAEELLPRYESIHSEIITIEHEDNLQARFKEFENFETSYYEIIALAQSVYDKNKQFLQTQEGVSIQANHSFGKNQSSLQNDLNYLSEGINSNNHPVQNVKLPVLQLKTFEGNQEQFPSFYASFKSLVHNNSTLDDMTRFLYLRSCLGRLPLKVIEHIEVVPTNYSVALSLLGKRYQDKDLLIQSHIKGIVEFPKLNKNSTLEIRELSDSLQAHLRALESLGEPVQSWSSIIKYIIVEKLDYNSREAWEIASSKGSKTTEISFLTDFLERRCTLLEKMAPNSNRDSRNKFKFNVRSKDLTFSNVSGSLVKTCIICTGTHFLYACKTFLNLNAQARLTEIKKHHLCFNCLKAGHSSLSCKSGNCKQCGKRHSTLLHEAVTGNSSTLVSSLVTDENQSAKLSATTSTITIASSLSNASHVLPTALIHINDSNEVQRKCVGLLDSGSQRSYMTYASCNRLKLKTFTCDIPIAGISGIQAQVTSFTQATVRSIHSNFKISVTFLLLQNITNVLPSSTANMNLLKIPKNIPLANPKFREKTKIDLLFGIDIFWQLLHAHQPLLNEYPYLYNTHLGYVVSGELPPKCTSTQSPTYCNLSTIELSRQLTQFWEIENIIAPRLMSPEEEQCELIFIKTTCRSKTGKFIVTIPLSSSPSVLGESKQNALKQFLSLEKRLQTNRKFKELYVEFMEEYKKLGHMCKIDSNAYAQHQYYIPHHGVYKKDSLTTKLRVVFNSSAASDNGISLNDIQLNGPVLQNDLFTILVRLRRFKYLLSGDCSKMYRSVLVERSQRSLQKIFWRSNPSHPLETFELCTVTYGEKASSFLAIRCLFELAKECEMQHPQIATIIRQDMYCDDLLTSCRTLEEALYVSTTTSSVLQSGGFTLRKWNSNYPEVLTHVHSEGISNNILAFGPDENNKTLGLLYNSFQDAFLYKIKEFETYSKRMTKRVILSFISTIFDPLGLLSPCTVYAKTFMQKLWLQKVGWDDPLPESILTPWLQFCHELSSLNSLRIPRQVIHESYKQLELHAFCDSSQTAYGSCIYIRSLLINGSISMHLLCSKARAAPLKRLTIPKLELCGALLMTKLVEKVRQCLALPIDDIVYWTDSTITLSWLKTLPHLLNSFVANRVTQILELSQSLQWKYTPTSKNPADLLTRGISANKIHNLSLWWHGPDFLLHSRTHWPSYPEGTAQRKDAQDQKSHLTHAVIIPKQDSLFQFERYSKFIKMKRVMAYCLRFLNNCKKPRKERKIDALTSAELNKALVQLARLSQLDSFPNEYKLIASGKPISKRSKLYALSPVMFPTDSVLRVSGRLANSDFNSDKKHPIIISSKHRFAILLFQHVHKAYLHIGPQQLLFTVRESFWPINGRNLAKYIVHQCINCFKARPRTIDNLLGNLPRERVTQNLPFSVVGTDYCGPFLIRDRETRGFKTMKCYVCLFICFSTKAIHLEPVTTLSTEAFISCLRCFTSRRGTPFKIYSDNGRTYCGAKTHLDELYKFISSNQNDLTQAATDVNIDWSFLPPYSPNLGGIWEAGIKSAKFHMKRVIGNALLTFRNFYTVLAQIEGVLNSRPLCQLSTHINDPLPLTPAHFLIGRSPNTVPDIDLININENRLTIYQRLQQIIQHFWRRWSNEYVSQMQVRTKWKELRKNIECDTIVLIKDEAMPPLRWKLGRIIAIHPGVDGIVRVVSVRTKDGTTKRAVSKICPLPIE